MVRNVEQEEMEYLLEKLISMTIHQSCVAAQHEASAKDTEVKMEQVRPFYLGYRGQNETGKTHNFP